MKRITSIIFMLFVLFDFYLHSQKYDYINRPLRDFQENYRFVNQGNNAGLNSKIDGTPYYNEKPVNGEIYTQESERFSEVPMWYNAYSDEIEFKMPDGAICVFNDPKQIFQIKLGNEILVYTEYISGNMVRNGYLFALYQGKSTLYQRRYKVLNPKVPSNGIINEIPAKFADKPWEYYLKPEKEKPQLLKSKKDLIKLLGDHTSEIEKYIKDANVSMNNADDLIKVLTYYDSL
jgi:hypothetical protein